MHGGLLIDEHRTPLTNLITWQDRRSTICRDDETTDLDEFRSRCPETEITGAGCRPSAGYLGVTLFSLQRQNRIPSESHSAVLLADWIAAEFSAQDPVTDRSNAASTGLYNLRDDRWSDALIAAAGIAADLLPEVRQSGEVIGDLAPETAARTGLPAGLPVCNAVGDNQAAVLGSVPAGESAVQINIGTGGQINWPVSEFVTLDGMDTRYLPLGRYLLVGAGTAGGAAYAWVNRTVGNWLRMFGVDADAESVYQRLNELAADVPDDANGLVCEPFFHGTRRQPNASGSFGGVTEENFTPGHVARAVLNGIAAALHQFFETAGEHRPWDVTRIIGSGNGLRKNPLLTETISRVFQSDVWLPEHREEAAYGAALLAGSSTGVWLNLTEAGQRIRLQRATG